MTNQAAGPDRKVVFVGLGLMGLPMAINLHRAGVNLIGFDVDAEARSRLEAVGAPVAESLELATRGACVIIMMLPESSVVASVARKALEVLAPGDLVIDCSTTEVGLTKQLAKDAAARGIWITDAPVSGGQEGAAAGTLSFMMGGERTAVEASRVYLEKLGKKFVHFGASGSGQLAKACHNMIIAVTMVGICEAFAIVEAHGLDPKQFYEVCLSAAARSWALEYRCPVPGVSATSPSSRNYLAGGSAAIVAKDVAIALAAAEEVQIPAKFGRQAMELYRSVIREGQGHLDFSVIYQRMRLQ